jgi:hypothetical protein
VYIPRLVMCRARLGSKARAWARLDQAQALKRREPSLGSRLRLGSARLGPGPGLEEGMQETRNGHNRNVLNGQLNDKLLTYNSSSTITLVRVNVVA